MGKVELSVRLLSHTPNVEDLVATAYRLCYSDKDIAQLASGVAMKNQDEFLKKVMAMGHLSPIEHVSFTFGVEGVSRSLLAQLTRHRIASFSVKSQRYVGAISKDGDVFNYIIPQSVQAMGAEAVEVYEQQMRTLQGWYDEWIERMGDNTQGYEDARFVLPNAAETKLIMTMNARELLHFLSLRCCNRAQWEIRAMAWEMLTLLKNVAPTLFRVAGPGCIAGACPEGKMSCGQAAQIRENYQIRFGDKTNAK